jgi:NADH dehydrogenase FAD-containing subunit
MEKAPQIRRRILLLFEILFEAFKRPDDARGRRVFMTSVVVGGGPVGVGIDAPVACVKAPRDGR